ncbi:MAG: ribosome recycling factor [Chitinophagales bacterium]
MTEEIMETAVMFMDEAISHLGKELITVRAGKASASMFNNVHVDYYGTRTMISQVANISNQDARTLTIQPWEKNMLQPIEKAIFAANLGVTPQNNGELIRINIPPLTEQRRKELAKQVKAIGEHAKVSIRNVRKDANNSVKKMEKDKDISADMSKDVQAQIQDLTNGYIKNVDKLITAKEKEIMSI